MKRGTFVQEFEVLVAAGRILAQCGLPDRDYRVMDRLPRHNAQPKLALKSSRTIGALILLDTTVVC